MTPVDFWLRVEPTPNGCWIWKGARSSGPRPYGSVRWNGRNQSAHRVAWEMVNGPVVQEMDVCHRCDNPPCVNPNHLFVGTRTDNMQDASAKGRLLGPKNLPRGNDHWTRRRPALVNRGSRNGHARLDERAVESIKARHAAGATTVALARDFAISRAQIHNIIHGLQWKHVA